MEPVVKFTNVYKTYSFYKNQSEKLFDILSIKKKNKTFSALRNVSFEVFKGESIGVIGINGSGKSTLSNLLAQVVTPSAGLVKIKGDPSLIAISAGLNNNLSGFENIRIKCLMLGLKNEEITSITPKIVEFADIGDFINQPVKNYSSGMKSRLGFAISIHTNPHILIIDEALSVGDQTFYEKCLKKMEEFKSQGKTIFFISHSISQIRTFCDRVLWLHFGEVKKFGDKTEVLNDYKEFINWFNELSEKDKKEYRKEMLEKQFKQEIEITRRSPRYAVKKEKSRKKFFCNFQLLLLSIVFIISVLWMLFPNVIYSSLNFLVEDKKVSQAKPIVTVDQKVVEEQINKQGLINKKEAIVYFDQNLSQSLGKVLFADQVFIEKKIGDVYKINHQNQSAFMSIEDASILPDDQIENDYAIQDFFSFLPGTFTQAYSFYMAFIEVPYEELKSSLRGLSNETQDIHGNKIQLYQSENLAYHFNKEDLVDGLIIYNIRSDDSMVAELMDKALIKNEVDGLYYLPNREYDYVINVNEGFISLKLK
jgi:teichoic acid transport system ATP-binding protein